MFLGNSIDFWIGSICSVAWIAIVMPQLFQLWQTRHSTSGDLKVAVVLALMVGTSMYAMSYLDTGADQFGLSYSLYSVASVPVLVALLSMAWTYDRWANGMRITDFLAGGGRAVRVDVSIKVELRRPSRAPAQWSMMTA